MRKGKGENLSVLYYPVGLLPADEIAKAGWKRPFNPFGVAAPKK